MAEERPPYAAERELAEKRLQQEKRRLGIDDSAYEEEDEDDV